MKIKFLGTGGAFDFEQGNASAIVSIAGKNILIDCGFSTIQKLAERKLLEEIDYILITHLHFDHIGSLPTLLAYYKYKTDTPAPKILLPEEKFGTEITKLLACSLEEDLASFGNTIEIPGIGYIETTNQHKKGMMSYAYYFTENDHLIYYSGDIGNAQVAKGFLDTRKETKIQVFHETTPRLDVAIHASYKEVEEKLQQYHTYVYHIAKENMPSDCTLKYVEDYPEFLY